MYIKTSELRHLDVINIHDGRHLGNVCDVDLDPDTGQLRALILDAPGRFLWWERREDIEIPWREVIRVGIDVILVNMKPEQSQHRTWRR